MGRCKQKQRGLRGLLCRWPSIAELRCTSLLRVVVSEMTYTVSSGTLNSTIPYHSSLVTLSSQLIFSILLHIHISKASNLLLSESTSTCLLYTVLHSRPSKHFIILFYYWSDAIASCPHDPRAFWSKINKLCSPPSACQIQYTASDLASHFVGKVEKIKASTADAETLHITTRPGTALSQFQPITAPDALKLLTKSPPSTAHSTLHRPGSSNVQPMCWPQSLLRCAMPH